MNTWTMTKRAALRLAHGRVRFIREDSIFEWLLQYGGTMSDRGWTVSTLATRTTVESRLRCGWDVGAALSTPPERRRKHRRKLPDDRPRPVPLGGRITAEDTATAEREAALTRTVRQLQADVDRLTRENARLRLDLARQNSY